MEKLNALFVLFRGDAGAVAAFVGPSRDIGHGCDSWPLLGRSTRLPLSTARQPAIIPPASFR
jgi:hypothetical protein